MGKERKASVFGFQICRVLGGGSLCGHLWSTLVDTWLDNANSGSPGRKYFSG